jgi:hypothetical protein
LQKWIGGLIICRVIFIEVSLVPIWNALDGVAVLINGDHAAVEFVLSEDLRITFKVICGVSVVHTTKRNDGFGFRRIVFLDLIILIWICAMFFSSFHIFLLWHLRWVFLRLLFWHFFHWDFNVFFSYFHLNNLLSWFFRIIWCPTHIRIFPCKLLNQLCLSIFLSHKLHRQLILSFKSPIQLDLNLLHFSIPSLNFKLALSQLLLSILVVIFLVLYILFESFNIIVFIIKFCT